MSLLAKAHKKFVNERRAERISSLLTANLRGNRRIIDIGCGDGYIGHLVKTKTGHVEITGVETTVRQPTHIPVIPFDGANIPFDDKTYDAAMLVDVLHHTHHPEGLLREAVRVARNSIYIKDHFLYGPVSKYILKYMDLIGNSHTDIGQPYNYQPPRIWHELFARLKLESEVMLTNLGLYAFPFSMLFDQKLHFFTRLKIADNQ